MLLVLVSDYKLSCFGNLTDVFLSVAFVNVVTSMQVSICTAHFFIKSCLKRRNALRGGIFNLILGFAIRIAQKRREELELTGTGRLVAYVNNINLVGENVNAETKHRCFVRH
jgi:hypothetical protein